MIPPTKNDPAALQAQYEFLGQGQGRIHPPRSAPVVVHDLDMKEVELRVLASLENKQAVFDAMFNDEVDWARIESRNLYIAPNATCAVRGHPPGPLSHYRWLPSGARSPLGVGGHIGPVETRWPGRLK